MASCKKDKTIQPNPNPGGTTRKVIKLSQTPSGYEETYEYDALGRFTKIDESTSDLYVYTFNGSNFTVKAYRKTDNNRVVLDLSGTLDAKGRVTVANGIEQYNANNPQNAQYKFTYDADGYLIKLNRDYSTNPDVQFDFIYSNGDVIEQKYSENGVYKHSVFFEYYTNMPNKLPFSEHYSISTLLIGLEGKPTAHLEKTGKLIYANNTAGWSYTKTWDLDAEGFPVKQVLTGSWNTTLYYHYQ